MISAPQDNFDSADAVLLPGQPGLRRHVRFDVTQDRVTGELADDYHHFTVTLEHDGDVVRHVEARPIRTPWDICSASSQHLAQRLIGTPLREAAGFDVQSSHCTHQFDLAIATAAHAFEAVGAHRYRIFVSDPDPDTSRRRALLFREEQPLLDWRMDGTIIQSPQALCGRNLKDLRGWIDVFPASVQEPAKLLRRAFYISEGRQVVHSPALFAERTALLTGACYVYQPERIVHARRNDDTVRDFSDGAVTPFT